MNCRRSTDCAPSSVEASFERPYATRLESVTIVALNYLATRSENRTQPDRVVWGCCKLAQSAAVGDWSLIVAAAYATSVKLALCAYWLEF